MLKKCSFEEFKKITIENPGKKNIVLYKEYLLDTITPLGVLLKLKNEENIFLLESVINHETHGRYSFIGLNPYAICYEENKKVFYKNLIIKNLEVLKEKSIILALQRILKDKNLAFNSDLPFLEGGAIGYFSYQYIQNFEPKLHLNHSEGLDACFMLTDTILTFDKMRETMLISSIVNIENYPSINEAYELEIKKMDEIFKNIVKKNENSKPSQKKFFNKEKDEKIEFKSEMSKEEFEKIVQKAKGKIVDGECIQIVLSQKFIAKAKVSSFNLYRALRLINPSPYNFFMKFDKNVLIGSSPEELVKLKNGSASTSPIAGTRPRGKDAKEDEILMNELVNDKKELAEHMMLVDLGRNDLGKVSEKGTVKVEKLAFIEKYSHVMHIVSNIKSKMAKDKNCFDLIKSVFPAGTLSGAPKIRAIEIIDELEKSARTFYGGAVGYFSYSYNLDFAIIIRTLFYENEKIIMRSGAGIVYDSDPEKEYYETINKAKAIFSAASFANSDIFEE